MKLFLLYNILTRNIPVRSSLMIYNEWIAIRQCYFFVSRWLTWWYFSMFKRNVELKNISSLYLGPFFINIGAITLTVAHDFLSYKQGLKVDDPIHLKIWWYYSLQRRGGHRSYFDVSIRERVLNCWYASFYADKEGVKNLRNIADTVCNRFLLGQNNCIVWKI